MSHPARTVSKPRNTPSAETDVCDPEAFGRLFQAHAQAIYRFCTYRCGDPDTAQDLVSITFLEAWRRRSEVEPGDSILPWLLGVANNVMRNQARSRRRHRAALGRLPLPLDEPDHAVEVTDRAALTGQLAAAIEALNALRSRDRDVVILILWQGLTYEQTAAALSIPIGTVRSRLSRARNILQRSIADASLEN